MELETFLPYNSSASTLQLFFFLTFFTLCNAVCWRCVYRVRSSLDTYDLAI